ncbi:MAG: flavodoxin-dependent (E)-4-hydroxy-3-methylbut-2-enyl-diphosphate synthase [Turicibacter sp.]|nr:flavodoxin-dependent (E)-4-hydroxy-3-methylbut-2-enyl-diphosphate synthase [Turicibacter sp.]MEE1237804.1 flavodoxin-dependent (E)-4-hydroxy-3-methylbut-2-enyl-diphosphate synthase [Turicibacter sp.]
MSNITHRLDTKRVKVGNLYIGGANEVIIQSMTTSKTHNIKATVEQINRLAEAGCQLVRVACLDETDALALKEIKSQISIPLVVDIHFDYRLALMAIEAGVDKIRINPGNIGNVDKVRQVVEAAKANQVAIRIGVNAGSLEKQILQKYGKATPEGMVESAKFHVQILEDLGFEDIIISLKASDTELAIKAYELAAKTFPYPLHLGITEAGTVFSGTIKSSIGLGILLNQGIGNTMRVSLSADPVEEIKVAREILKNFGLIKNAATLISCPTCGRIQYNLIPLAQRVEDYLTTIPHDIHVAVMGCAVNGPGEAKTADIGIAGGKGEGLLIKQGKIIRKVPEEKMFDTLVEEIQLLIKERESQK